MLPFLRRTHIIQCCEQQLEFYNVKSLVCVSREVTLSLMVFICMMVIVMSVAICGWYEDLYKTSRIISDILKEVFVLFCFGFVCFVLVFIHRCTLVIPCKITKCHFRSMIMVTQSFA